jgi:hypothetical protein
MKKAKGESLKTEGNVSIPKTLRQTFIFPDFLLARVQFESLQRGELDPSFLEESELPSPLFSAKN